MYLFMDETKREHYRKGKYDIMYENNEGSKWELTMCAETFESGVKIVMSQKKMYLSMEKTNSEHYRKHKCDRK